MQIQKNNKEIQQAERSWRSETLKKEVNRLGERKKEFVTESGLTIKDIYTPLDLESLGFNYIKDLGFPGEPPNVRGIEPNMYRSRLWPVSAFTGYGRPEDSNRRYKFLMECGLEAFSVALDIPTQLGYDSDHPLASGEVGRVGVVIDSLRDFETLFDGIPLDQLRYFRINFNAMGPIGAALAIAAGEKQGLTPDQFSVVLQNDPFREFIARKLYIFPPKPSLRMAVDVIEYCTKNCPTWQPIHVSGYQTREAGSTAIQEVAFTLANAITYIESVLQRGIAIDAFAKNMCVLLNLNVDLFEEVAKVRAFRKLWGRIMQDRFNAQNTESLRPRLLNATAGSACLAQQPLNNIIRITLMVLAGALGSSNHISTHAYDEGLGIPTEKAAEIAARTQQIIAEESGVTNTIDPMGGSYFLESLTLKIEGEVWRYLEKIETKGGALACIENGYFQNEISKAAWEYQKQIENGQKVKVGLNKYMKKEDISIKAFKVSPTIEEEMIKRVNRLRQERDNQKVKKRLEEIREAAKGTDNMVPVILEAVKAYATVGEVSDALRDIFGEYREHLTS